jgi:hypothetical protein
MRGKQLLLLSLLSCAAAVCDASRLVHGGRDGAGRPQERGLQQQRSMYRKKQGCVVVMCLFSDNYANATLTAAFSYRKHNNATRAPLVLLHLNSSAAVLNQLKVFFDDM